jgi:hypothetical protein
VNDSLPKKIAAAINAPGDAAGRRRGPSWGRGNDGYAYAQESHGDHAARAVIATLEDEGRLLPVGRRIAELLPVTPNRGSTLAVLQLEGPSQIFRFMVNLLGAQVEFGAAARAVLVDLRDQMTPALFDPMARSLLGQDRYEKIRHDFLRNWTCRGCENTIYVGRRYAPDHDAGAVCAKCCKGYPEYEARLVTRQREPQPVTA